MTGATHLGCVQHCLHHHMHTARGRANTFLTRSPESIIIPINLLHLQAWVKKISKLILPCLEAHFGDLVTFQPCGHFQSGMTSRCYPACRLLRHEGKLPKHTGHCATWQLTVEQLSRSADVKQHACNSHSSTDTAALESSCSCGCTILFYSRVFLCR